MDYVKISNHKFETLIALTSQEQERGLMYREPPLPIMIFPYENIKLNAFFWMKNVKAPLDIVFCLNNKISSIWNAEANSTRIVGNGNPTDLVIELPAGTCKSLGIKPGDPIDLEYSKGALMKIFMLKTGLLK